MNSIGIFFIGVLAGMLLSWIYGRHNLVGSLRIDQSDPEDDAYMFLELSKDLVDVRRKKTVSVKIENKNYISRQ